MFLPKFKHYRDIFMKIKSMLRNSCSLLFFLKAVTVEVLAYLICHLEVEMFHYQRFSASLPVGRFCGITLFPFILVFMGLGTEKVCIVL